MVLRNVVPRQGTETDTENINSCVIVFKLRNVVPRQGTETSFYNLFNNLFHIEKCSSPTGDGNNKLASFFILSDLLRNVVPRQGTETGDKIIQKFLSTD